jgi:monofunctional glycosyltransferase
MGGKGEGTPQPEKAKGEMPRRHSLAWRVARAALIAVLAVHGLVLLYRFMPPPVTPLMVIRLVEGEGLHKTWEPSERISADLFRAVIASEDAKFCDHHGFDWDALSAAADRYQEGRRAPGASTISMQTAKNVFLWPGRSIVRKAFEAYFTVWLELLWGKERIAEVYVNIIEWGPGLYGAEAAAQSYFAKPAAELNAREASLMAAILPNPRRWSAARPTAYILGRAQTIRARMESTPVESNRRICP